MKRIKKLVSLIAIALLTFMCLGLVSCVNGDVQEETKGHTDESTEKKTETETESGEVTTIEDESQENTTVEETTEEESSEEESTKSAEELKAEKIAEILANYQEKILPIGGWSTPYTGLRDGYCEIEGNYDAMYKLLADTGINFMITLEEWSSDYWIIETLQSANKAGMKVYYNTVAQATDMEWTAHKIDLMLESDAAGALAGIYVKDEPTIDDMPFIKERTEAIRAYLKEKGREDIPVFSNLLPHYANKSWTGDYDEYVRSYIEMASPDIMMFDYYPYTSSIDTLGDMMYNIVRVKVQCDEQNIPLWPFIQSSSSPGMIQPDSRQMLANINVNLALGAKGFTYFLTCEPSPNSGYGHMIDTKGNTTKVYNNVKTVNGMVLGMKGVYLDYDNCGVMFANMDSNTVSKISNVAPEYVCSTFDHITEFTATKSARVVTGCFANEEGQKAIYVANCESKKTSNATYTFDQPMSGQIWGSEGLEDLFENVTELTVNLNYAEGYFIIFDK